MTDPYREQFSTRYNDDQLTNHADFRAPQPPQRRVLLPVVLFVATCASTYMAQGLALELLFAPRTPAVAGGLRAEPVLVPVDGIPNERPIPKTGRI